MGDEEGMDGLEDVPCFVPYNLITQHSIPDKSIADCVEALIGTIIAHIQNRSVDSRLSINHDNE